MMKVRKLEFRKISYLIILVLLIISCKSKDISCRTNFSTLAIKDFQLGSSLKDINEINNQLKLVLDSNEYGYSTFHVTDSIQYNGKPNQIRYIFSFKDDALVSYHFDFRGNEKVFREMVGKLYKAKSKLIKTMERRMSYFYKDEACQHSFNLIFRNDEMYISGGVESNSFPRITN